MRTHGLDYQFDLGDCLLSKIPEEPEPLEYMVINRTYKGYVLMLMHQKIKPPIEIEVEADQAHTVYKIC